MATHGDRVVDAVTGDTAAERMRVTRIRPLTVEQSRALIDACGDPHIRIEKITLEEYQARYVRPAVRATLDASVRAYGYQPPDIGPDVPGGGAI